MVIIQNITGKTIKTTPLSPKNYQQQIDISNLVHGVYYVSFTLNGEQDGVEKMVIVK